MSSGVGWKTSSGGPDILRDPLGENSDSKDDKCRAGVENPRSIFAMRKERRNGYCEFTFLAVVLRKTLPWIVVFILVHLALEFRAVGRISGFHEHWERVLGRRGDCGLLLDDARARLRDSVVFHPLKGPAPAVIGQTNIISEINATFDGEQALHVRFPSPKTASRVLCLAGNDSHDGTKNSYAQAWPDALPGDAIFLSGLTYVSENFYDYKNLWHGLGPVVPFVAWYNAFGCRPPARWVLYTKGELQREISPWLHGLLEASMGEVRIEKLDRPSCFEEAVLVRHDKAGMSPATKLRAFDTIRCKARSFCNVSEEVNHATVRLTLLLRRGARSFKNDSAVVEVFRRACTGDCQLTVAWAGQVGNFCDQVRLMSGTDILATPYGAQMTNMIFMDKNSSLMEFFPSGWKEEAGPGQFAYHWLARESGMRHRGVWRDANGPVCDTPQDRSRCFSIYFKNQQIGHDEEHFFNWTAIVVAQAMEMKLRPTSAGGSSPACSCA